MFFSVKIVFFGENNFFFLLELLFSSSPTVPYMVKRKISPVALLHWLISIPWSTTRFQVDYSSINYHFSFLSLSPSSSSFFTTTSLSLLFHPKFKILHWHQKKNFSLREIFSNTNSALFNVFYTIIKNLNFRVKIKKYFLIFEFLRYFFFYWKIVIWFSVEILRKLFRVIIKMIFRLLI